jgi:asparagine synthase (glutamine-hydrolysing)
VRKLLPGHALTVSRRGCTDTEYWDVHYAPRRATERDLAAELHELLLDSARIQLRSDVPLGVFLSGGLDSSSVVSLLSEAGVTGIQTFSVAYRDGGKYDETSYARLVADHFHTDHHVLYVEPQRFQEFIPGYIWHMDEPVTEAAALSLYFISRELRRHVTVALSGEGADELFGGYSIYRYMQWIESYRRLPRALRATVAPLAARLPSPLLRKYARLADIPLAERYLGVSLHEPWHRHELYSQSFANEGFERGEAALAPYYARTTNLDPLTRMLYSDFKTWLVDDLLIKADKMTMANSVELRVPFLDHRVVEFAATVPSAMKMRGGEVKRLLKKAMASRLPAQILEREKVGFPTPLARMFQQDLSAYLRDTLLSTEARQRGYFDPAVVTRLLDEHLAGRADRHKTLWQLVVLEEWHRCFADTPARRMPGPALVH